MPPKRPYNKSRRKLSKKYGLTVKKANISASVIQSALKRVLFKNAETKQAQISSSDYQQIKHNLFINIDNEILKTEQGVTDPTTNSNYCRIGDEITLLKAKFCMMLEINERMSDVTYRILLVKSSRGDTPTNTTLWNGLSANKMLDTINYERFSVIYQKWGKIKAAPNATSGTPADAATIPLGQFYSTASPECQYKGRATKIIKFSVDGKKFAKEGKIVYDSGGTQQKFFDYNLLIFAYANYGTHADTTLVPTYNILAVNDYYHLLKYKDI